jgi:hypothetical protein
MVRSVQTMHLSCIKISTISEWTEQSSTRPTPPRSFIRCLQYYFRAYSTFDTNRAPILHYLKTNRTEIPLEPRHLGVPSSVSKTISMPMVCLVQTVHLSYTDTNTMSKQTKTRFQTTHVSSNFHQVHPKLFMSLWYVQCKPCIYLASRLVLSPNGPNRAPPHPRHLEVPSGASKTIYEPMVHLTQTEHVSSIDANTVSK